MRVDNYKQDVSSKKTIHIVHILDASSSMSGGKMNAALEGINSEIEELKKDSTVDYLFSLVAFSYSRRIKRIYWQKHLQDVEKIDIKADGYTALYQAIGETLEEFPQDNPVLVKIFTDGGENDSIGKYKNADEVKNLIDILEKKDFTITFVGTKEDVESIQRNLSIAKGNTLSHDNTPESVKMSFRKSMVATRDYTSNVAKGEFTKTMSFYNND